MPGWSLVLKEEPYQVNQGNLRSIFCNFEHLHQILASWRWNISEGENGKPLVEIFNSCRYFLFDFLRIDKFLNKLFHFVYVGDGVEALRGKMSWLELVELK